MEERVRRLRESFACHDYQLLADLAIRVGSPSLHLHELLPLLDQALSFKVPPPIETPSPTSVPTIPSSQPPPPTQTAALELATGKAREYQERLAEYQPPLLEEGEIEEIAERVRGKEKRLEELQAALRPYQLMPADLTLARLECARLESRLER